MDEREQRRVTLLDDVETAARRVQELDAERRAAREELRARIVVARDEGIPFSLIARRAGLSLERVRQIYAGR